jgi:hypothetical protein
LRRDYATNRTQGDEMNVKNIEDKEYGMDNEIRAELARQVWDLKNGIEVKLEEMEKLLDRVITGDMG